MINARVFLSVFGSAVLSASQLLMSQIVFTNDFEDDPFGQYSRSNLEADWNSPSGSNGVDEGRVSIVNEDGSKVLRVEYPEGLFGSGDDRTGAQWRTILDQGYEALELEYRIKFEDGFDFVRGGKLPGLAGGTGNSGGNRPNGTDGFSARMHWRTDGSSGSPLDSDETDRANIAQYLYHPDQTTNNGVNGDDLDYDDGPSGNWEEFESDRWYHLRHRIIMNTPGTNGGQGLRDGVIQAWLDGVQVLDVDDIRFRDVASLQIDQLYFSTFFGGGSSRWATSKDEVAYFDDFVVRELGQLGDFDFDGDVDLDDLDQYNGNIGASPTGALEALDLDADGNIDQDDMIQHYTQLVQTSDGGQGTVAGDANLDGTVNVLGDGFLLVANLGNSSTSWAQGDFNGDQTVDVLRDGFALVANLGATNGNASSTSSVSAIPEAGSISLLTLTGIAMTVRRRRSVGRTAHEH